MQQGLDGSSWHIRGFVNLKLSYIPRVKQPTKSTKTIIRGSNFAILGNRIHISWAAFLPGGKFDIEECTFYLCCNADHIFKF
jgi:hypothetical protein